MTSLKYIKLKGGKNPETFVVAVDGSYAIYWYCPVINCSIGDENGYIKQCEAKTNSKCKVFARKRYIKWKNGINPGKGKVSKISSKLNLNELKSKLTELGFYGNASTTTTKTEEKKETKKTDNQKQKVKDKCKELGFTKGTEDFDDCVTIALSKQ